MVFNFSFLLDGLCLSGKENCQQPLLKKKRKEKVSISLDPMFTFGVKGLGCSNVAASRAAHSFDPRVKQAQLCIPAALNSHMPAQN